MCRLFCAKKHLGAFLVDRHAIIPLLPSCAAQSTPQFQSSTDKIAAFSPSLSLTHAETSAARSATRARRGAPRRQTDRQSDRRLTRGRSSDGVPGSSSLLVFGPLKAILIITIITLRFSFRPSPLHPSSTSLLSSLPSFSSNHGLQGGGRRRGQTRAKGREEGESEGGDRTPPQEGGSSQRQERRGGWGLGAALPVVLQRACVALRCCPPRFIHRKTTNNVYFSSLLS